jgi:L-fucose mutarotase/ribose pyranase (RbsD/FucU family)
MKKPGYFALFLIILCCSCDFFVPGKSTTTEKGWKELLTDELPMLGHRNWILVVDKAFPAQTAAGIKVINTGEALQNVLQFTLQKIDRSLHVKPIIYTDKELGFITPALVPLINDYKKDLQKTLKGIEPLTLMHDSVFVKIDQASKLFKVIVLKTEETIPYSSVFIQLDCKYWSPENEKSLRELMKK